jgi:uncharacterized protein GlcG (DUF336 family)
MKARLAGAAVRVVIDRAAGASFPSHRSRVAHRSSLSVAADLVEKMKTDKALEAKLDADPSLRARPGGLPIMVANEVIGAIGVGGTPTRNGIAGGLGDEACAKAGLDKIKDRLK